MTDYQGKTIQGEVEADTGVLHIRFNRAPVNAASSEFIFEIGHLFSLAKGDPNVRAIVLSSTIPKYFTAGLDLKEAAQSLNSSASDPARRALGLKQHILGRSRASGN
jgi:delta(3,5)-delta(2,4)-dienoyl-CoA isomerase